MFCKNCSEKLEGVEKFCGSCGEEVKGRTSPDSLVEEVPIQEFNNVEQTSQIGSTDLNHSAQPNKFNLFGLIATVIAAFLWFSAPFMAINLLTMGNQPTAYQLITGNVFVIGDITGTPAFLAAAISGCGILICFILIMLRQNRAVGILAFITCVIIGFVSFEILTSGVRFDEVVGLGYIGIFLLLLLTSFSKGK